MDVPKEFFGTSSPDSRHNTVRSPAEICLGTRPDLAVSLIPASQLLRVRSGAGFS
jgi:hypothetical protein